MNRHAYTFCVLEQFWRHLKRRDIYADASTEWRNPQARLLEGGAWEAIRSDVLTTLGLPENPGALLAEHAQTLDAAYREAGGRLAVNTEVRVDDAGKIHLTGVKAVEEPPSLVDLGLAEARGWSAATIAGVFYGLKAVLDGHTGDGPVPLSQVRQRVRPRSHSSATRIAEVLAELGMLHDDTTAAIRTWIDRRTGELPAGFGRDVRAWLVVLLDGDARTRPRSHATVHFHFGRVRPFIECWAATRGHLREITSGDVDSVLEPLRGHRRYNAITALRSLFRFAKRRGLTFADPTAHLRGGRGAGRTVLPMTAEQIRAVQQAAATPAQRLAIALAAVHAARPGAIRELTLEDIDLPSRRISIAGHRQPLGELTRNALLAWLDYRRATWPDTANRHVLITRKSALGTGPVSASYLADYLGRHQRGISLEHIRRDRILQEARATGADPLHLALVFNIDHTNAMAYANAARNLLTGPAEQELSPHRAA